MKTRRLTAITVETHEILLIKQRGGLVRGWCADCGTEVRMIGLAEIALAGSAPEATCRQAKTNGIHMIEFAGGLSFICLNSLLEEISRVHNPSEKENDPWKPEEDS